MEAYITGMGNISAQETFDNSVFLDMIRPLEVPVAWCVEPNYKEFIQPIQLRRMGRILRMGVTAAARCLNDAGVEVPDAIITGTGLGLVQDTEKFLTSVIENDEKFLNPTSFIQSTHNTVGAHIAVMLKCNHYNLTYVHGNISFENALLDSMMQLDENPGWNILLGGLDEMTEYYYKISANAGLWDKYYPVENKPTVPERSIVGEGAAYFLLKTKKESSSYAKFLDVATFYKPASIKVIEQNILEILNRNDLSIKDIDLVLLGQNEQNGDIIYQNVSTGILKDSNLGFYKHLCGEYYTSSAFATWFAARMLKHQEIPNGVLLKGGLSRPLRNILIWNHLRNINHSLIVLSAC
jgi:3-oxoacyl-[acyl-carrier-protein] synthase II